MPPFMLLLALLAQPAASPAPQPAWQALGLSGDGSQARYDPASVVRAGPVTRVGLRFDSRDGTYMLSTMELRCADFASRMVGVTSHAADGHELGRNDIVTPFRLINAGTFVERLAHVICGATQGPADPQ